MSSEVQREPFFSLEEWVDCADSGEAVIGRSTVYPRDRLVRWMSEKGQGTWREFQEAHAWVNEDVPGDKKAWWTARDLQDLAYVEFAWGEDRRWSMAPPVLLALPQSDGLAYLAGARPRTLLSALGGDPDCYPIAAAQGPDGPHGVFVALDRYGDGDALATRLGIAFQFAAAEMLADVLPSLADLVGGGVEKRIPPGFDLERFDDNVLRWAPCPEDSDDVLIQSGFYRARAHGSMEFRLVMPGAQAISCTPAVGIYEVLRWTEKQVVIYDAVKAQLSVPRAVGLPALHARVATLSSGLLPQLIAHRADRHAEDLFFHRYENVSAEVAAAIMGSLQQGDELDA